MAMTPCGLARASAAFLRVAQRRGLAAAAGPGSQLLPGLEGLSVVHRGTLQDRLHRARVRQEADGPEMKHDANFKKVGERLGQQVGEEQRLLLRALRESAAALDWEGALAVLGTIPKDPGPEWLPVYRSILDVCCKALQYEPARRVFQDELPKRDVISYNMMLGLCGRLRLGDEFDSLLRQMDAECVSKDAVTYPVVMSGHAELRRWEAALSTFQELKCRTDLESITNWEVAYTSVMSACARGGQRLQVRSLLSELSSKCTVKHSHWNTAIIACGSDLEAAQKTFAEMRAAGLTPRMADWKVLLRCCRDIAAQRKIYQQALAELPEDTPLDEIWADMLRLPLHLNDLSAVQWAFQQMRDRGVDPNSERAQQTPALQRVLHWARIQITQAKGKQMAERRKKSPDLPVGWSTTVDPTSGRQYFWRDADPAGTTTWSRPESPVG